MKSRYDKLVVVRATASRMATASFVDSAARLAGHESLADRLEAAAAALSPEAGVASGAGLAARLELAGRMQAAHFATQDRIDEARADRDDGALARRAARRALDAVVDIRRSHQKAAIIRIEAKAASAKPKDVDQ